MLLSLYHGSDNIELEVILRKRKTLAIEVEAPGKVYVYAPLGASREEIIKRVQPSAPWIMKKLQAFIGLEPYRPKEFINGETFMYLGAGYPLEIMKTARIKRPAAGLKNGSLLVQITEGDDEKVKKTVEKWYRQEARKNILHRLEFYRPLIDAVPANVRIKGQKKRWGSCSATGNLNFNWKTIMAPQPVVDYIVVHEMCHMVHLNHSPKFWGLVRSVIPDYNQPKNWLNKYGYTLNL